MDGSTFWYIQRQMEELIALAEDRGVDEEDWFIGGWNNLCARWQPRLYQRLVYMCIHNSDKPILPTKFPIPFKRDDMEAVTNGPYKIGTIKDTDIVAGTDTLFLGEIKRLNEFEKRCNMCGICILDLFGDLCPISRCPKSMLNGPCGGSKDGKCEVDNDMECVWDVIYRRLKEKGQLDLMKKIQEPKDWSPSVEMRRTL